MPRVIHFEIHADKPERAAKFYEKWFSWQIKKWEGPVDYWLVKTGEEDQPGIDGAIMHRVSKGTVYNTIDVPSVDEFVKKIVKAGGKIVQKKAIIPINQIMLQCRERHLALFDCKNATPTCIV